MLSLALIVKNEEKNLARCLSSAKGVWDELIIVDTGSTDKTIEIAKQYTDNVYHFDWIDDFGKARNFSFSKCTQPWIMWLDADDVLHPEDVENIRAEMPSISENPTLDYIVMNYHYFVIPDEEAAKEKGWSLSDTSHATLARERIIRRTKATWIGRVHEHIPVDFSRSKSIDAAVWHMRDEEDRIADRNRNIRIMKLEVEERPTERNYYYLGQEYSDSGMGDEAVEAYMKAFEITKRIDTKFQAAFKIARIHKALGKTEEAIEWFFKSLNYHVAYREPFVDLAQVYFDKRDFSKAIVWLETSLKVSEPDNPIMIIQKEYYGWLPLDRLAKAYYEMKRFDEASETLKKLWRETRNPVIFTDLETVQNAKKATFKHPAQPVKLNLGCGEKPMPGFVNCDLFPNPHVDEVFSLDDIPYADSTIQEINSEHSLEHLPRLRAEKALREWARVLAPGGKLTLKVPDVELCCRSFVDNPQQRESWWLFTLYGIQDFRHLAADNPFLDEVNYGQIHYTGFTKDSLSKLLRQNGLEIDYIGNYDGWDTPSIEVRAHKAIPASQKKIAFINNSLVPRYLSYGDYWLDAFRVAGHQVDEFRYEEIHTLPAGYDLYFFVEVRYLPTQISDQAHPRLLYTTENPTTNDLSSFDFIATPDAKKVRAWAALGHRALAIANEQRDEGTKNIFTYLAHDYPDRSWSAKPMLTPKIVDIIIPSYKNLPYLKLAVESVRENTEDYSLIVANSGDDQEVRDWLEQQSDIILIDTPEKRSFSQNINRALMRSRNDVVILNNDVIVGKGWLEALKESPYDISNPYSNCDKGWIHSNNVIAGGVSLRPDMLIEQVDLPALMKHVSDRDDLISRPWVAFYATHIRRKVIDKVGLLSDSFINGCEDFDYCRRAEKFGFTCGHTFKSWVFHFGGKSRKIHEQEGPQRHQEEDIVNQELMKHRTKPTVVIYTGRAWEKWTVETINTTGIGGSETCAALLAKEFVSLGYRAVLIGDCGGLEGDYNGVEYLNYTEFDSFKNTNYIDHFISSRTLHPLSHRLDNGQNYVWSHDIWIPGMPQGQPMLNGNKVTKYICLSPWHVDFFSNHHQVSKDQIYIQRNGLDLSRYDRRHEIEKDPYRLLYSSSPDRGLIHLLRMFPRMKEVYPELNLQVFYGFDNWEKAAKQRDNSSEIKHMEEVKGLLKQPGVDYHGRVSQARLAEEQMRASVWLYPTEFTETSCISVVECMLAGAVPVCTSLAALATTLPDNCGIKLPPGDIAGCERQALRLLGDKSLQDKYRKAGEAHVLKMCGWRTIAEDWIKMFEEHKQLASTKP